MKKALLLGVVCAFAVALSGCGESQADKALDTAAPPPGPNAVANPPTKPSGVHPPSPPTVGTPGAAPAGAGGK